MKQFVVMLQMPIQANDERSAQAAGLVVSRELAGCFPRDVRSEAGAYVIPAVNASRVAMFVEEGKPGGI